MANCANNCSSRGLCEHGKCFCNPGYEGQDCAVIKPCPISANSSAYCNDQGTCLHGQCYCKPGWNGTACDILDESSVKEEEGGLGVFAIVGISIGAFLFGLVGIPVVKSLLDRRPEAQYARLLTGQQKTGELSNLSGDDELALMGGSDRPTQQASGITDED
jgi:hypothetical protein